MGKNTIKVLLILTVFALVSIFAVSILYLDSNYLNPVIYPNEHEHVQDSILMEKVLVLERKVDKLTIAVTALEVELSILKHGNLRN